MTRTDKGERLGRVLGRAGVVAGGRVSQWVHSRRVQVDGVVIDDPQRRIPAGAQVRIDDAPVDLSWRTKALVLHKPVGLIVAGQDPEGVGTVFDLLATLLPAELSRFHWHAVGRLDRDTTGLLVFTNDEQLVEHATNPDTHLSKRYVARVEGKLTDATLEPLRLGVELHDGPTRPAQAALRAPGIVEITITEGRNRQVRRMLDAVKLAVLALTREAIGGLVLDVAHAAYRELTDEELRVKLGFEPRQG